MTKALAKQWLPIVQALADGKQLQFLSSVVGDIPGAREWVDVPTGDKLIDDPSRYRVKPMPREFWLGGTSTGTYQIYETFEISERKRAEGYRIIHVREVL